MSTRRARRRGRGSASFRSLVDRWMHDSYPERGEEWIGKEVESAVMVTRELTGRPVAEPQVGKPQYVTSSSSAGSQCVAVAVLPNGTVLLRDDKNPDKPPTVFTRDEWQAWIGDIKRGTFDFRS